VQNKLQLSNRKQNIILGALRILPIFLFQYQFLSKASHKSSPHTLTQKQAVIKTSFKNAENTKVMAVLFLIYALCSF
jgi:hypothetical protein